MSLLGTKTSNFDLNESPKKLSKGQKKKFEINVPSANYYKSLQIQPGSAFFRALLECKYPINTLSLNVPAMLINLGVTVLLRTSIFSYFKCEKVNMGN